MVKKIKGMIDPGHAKNTPGKKHGSFSEYLSNRNIAKKLKNMLEATGKFEIVFSCDLESPNDLSLSARAANAIAQGCEFIVSIHSNAGPESARGTETFIHTNSQTSLPFAEVIQKNVVTSLETKNRGVKRADFGILRGTYKNMLSCLVEGEFYTNSEANKWMITEDYENKYAQGVANGLFAFYKVEAPQPGEHATDQGGKWVFTDKVTIPNTAYWQAEILTKEYQEKGFKCYALPVNYKPFQAPAKNDPYPFVVETDFKNANIVLMQLKQKGFAQAKWEAL